MRRRRVHQPVEQVGLGDRKMRAVSVVLKAVVTAGHLVVMQRKHPREAVSAIVVPLHMRRRRVSQPRRVPQSVAARTQSAVIATERTIVMQGRAPLKAARAARRLTRFAA